MEYLNGQIVAATNGGKLTIMDEDLEVIEEFPGTDNEPLSIAVNDTYLAMGDLYGTVRYYERNTHAEPKVSFQIVKPIHCTFVLALQTS